MRLLRPLVAAALGMSVLVAGHAGAATTAATCNILTDDPGDANDPLETGLHVLPAPFNDPMQDIVGGDLGTTKTDITGVIKLAQAPGLDVWSPQGDIYYLVFAPTSAANRLLLIAQSDSSGAMTYSAGDIEPQPGGVENYTPMDGVVVKGKVSGTSIVMTVSLAALKPLASIKVGAKINGVMAKSYGLLEVPAPPPADTGLLVGGDDTEEALKPVVVGAKSCVVPVK